MQAFRPEIEISASFRGRVKIQFYVQLCCVISLTLFSTNNHNHKPFFPVFALTPFILLRTGSNW